MLRCFFYFLFNKTRLKKSLKYFISEYLLSEHKQALVSNLVTSSSDLTIIKFYMYMCYP